MPAVNEYIESDVDPDAEWWQAFARHVADDVAIARTIPDVRMPLGPVAVDAW